MSEWQRDGAELYSRLHRSAEGRPNDSASKITTSYNISEDYRAIQAELNAEDGEKRKNIQVGNCYRGVVAKGVAEKVYEVIQVSKYDITIQEKGNPNAKKYKIGLSNEMFNNPVEK